MKIKAMKINTVRLSNLQFSFRNLKEFGAIYKDIFILKEYKPDTKIKTPYILDCGSHIGVSVLYFKKIFPKAEIVAFEPNPENFKLLKLNLSQNNIENVELVNAAVADKNGQVNFYITRATRNPWTWGDAAVRNKWYNPKSFETIKVRSVRLSTYINKQVDLIKLDIEGIEGRVLKEIENKFHLVKEIIMEFHGSSTNKENNLEEILSILGRNSFEYTIKQEGRLFARKVEFTKIKKTDPYWLIIHAKKI